MNRKAEHGIGEREKSVGSQNSPPVDHSIEESQTKSAKKKIGMKWSEIERNFNLIT